MKAVIFKVPSRPFRKSSENDLNIIIVLAPSVFWHILGFFEQQQQQSVLSFWPHSKRTNPDIGPWRLLASVQISASTWGLQVGRCRSTTPPDARGSGSDAATKSTLQNMKKMQVQMETMLSRLGQCNYPLTGLECHQRRGSRISSQQIVKLTVFFLLMFPNYAFCCWCWMDRDPNSQDIITVRSQPKQVEIGILWYA